MNSVGRKPHGFISDCNKSDGYDILYSTNDNLHAIQRGSFESVPRDFVVLFQWNVTWYGSFPIERLNKRILAECLDRCVPTVDRRPVAAIDVILRVSVLGICIYQQSTVINSHTDGDAANVIAHSLRDVICVIGRKESRQLAYVTNRRSDGGDSRVCHVFQTATAEQVKIIERSLSEAFVFVSRSSTIVTKTQHASTVRFRQNNCLSSVTTNADDNCASCWRCNANSMRLAVEDSGEEERGDKCARKATPPTRFLSRGRRQVNSRCNLLLQRIVGSATSLFSSASRLHVGKTTRDANHAFRSSQRQHRVNSSMANFRSRSVVYVGERQPTRLRPAEGATRLRGEEETPRRPANVRTRHSAYTTLSRRPQSLAGDQVSVPALTTFDSCGEYRSNLLAIQNLKYDEETQEWIFSINDSLLCILSKLRYFRNECLRRENVLGEMHEMPEGAFLLHFNATSSKDQLTLSIRTRSEYDNCNLTAESIVTTHDGLSQHTILLNQTGFFLKGSNQYFSSLPLLITHHTVIKGSLPCRLVFT